MSVPEDTKKALASIPGLGILAVLAFALMGKPGGPATKEADKTGAVPPAAAAKAADAKAGGKPDGLPPHVQFLTDHKYLHVAPGAWPPAGTRKPFVADANPNTATKPVGEADPPDTDLPDFARDPERPTDVTVMTVPDPIETHLGHWFDHLTEAVTRAMADDPGEAFVYEAHWHPWALDESATARKKAAAEFGKYPGVLVYRSVTRPDARRVVLLVGENPMNGVHPRAMAAALDLALAAGGPRVPVLGPTFTGSMPSVLRAVRDWQQTHRRATADVVSGSATAIRPPDARDWPGLDFSRLRLHTTQIPNDILQAAALRYLDTPGELPPYAEIRANDVRIDRRRIAYLYELNSGFGAAAAGGGTADGGEWVFRFPMHISKLAGMQSQERRERDEKLGLEPAGGTKLTKLDETRSGQDMLPAADEPRTALMNRRLLDDIWFAIKRERVRYVGIFCSDVRDKIFLIEQLRANCPNVQPFVIGADMHLAHPEYLQATRGVLIASTYPLNPSAQQWAKLDRIAPGRPVDARRVPFAASYAEGTYNAVLALRVLELRPAVVPEAKATALAALASGLAGGHQTRLTEQAKDRIRETDECVQRLHRTMLDYRPPFFAADADRSRPPVWITTVGENGRFVPLAYLTGYDVVPLLYPAPAGEPSQPHYSPPQLGQVRFLLWLLLAAALACLVWWWSLWDGRTWPDAMTADDRAARSLYWSVVAAALLAGVTPFLLHFFGFYMQGGVTLGYWFRRYPDDGYVWWDGLAVLAAAVAAVGVYGLAAVTLHTDLDFPCNWSARSAACGASWVVLHGTAAGVVIVLLHLLAYPELGKNAGRMSYHRLAMERTCGVTSGYSVLLPTLAMSFGLLASAATALVMLRRQVEARFACPYAGGGQAPPHPLFGTVWGLAADARCYGKWYHYLLPVVLALLMFLSIWTRAFRTCEGIWWDVVALAGLAALLTAVVTGGVWLSATLAEADGLLRRIALVPMVGTFERLPDKAAKLAFRVMVYGKRRTTILHMLQSLADDVRRFGGFTLVSPIGRAVVQVRAVRVADELDEAQVRVFTDLSQLLSAELAGRWPTSTLVEKYGTLHAKKADAKPDPPPAGDERPAWQEPAEQYVALCVALFMARFFDRIRHLAAMLVITTTALMLAATSYAFQPEQIILYWVTGVTAVVVSLLVYVYYRINVNEIVSRLNRTSPDRFTPDASFFVSILTGVVPLVVLTAAQLTGRLRSVFEPVLNVLR